MTNGACPRSHALSEAPSSVSRCNQTRTGSFPAARRLRLGAAEVVRMKTTSNSTGGTPPRLCAMSCGAFATGHSPAAKQTRIYAEVRAC